MYAANITIIQIVRFHIITLKDVGSSAQVLSTIKLSDLFHIFNLHIFVYTSGSEEKFCLCLGYVHVNYPLIWFMLYVCTAEH